MEKDKIIVVMRRSELKYHLSKEQLAFFKNKIEEHMRVDKYGLTTIFSIYFDTPTFTVINKSIERPKYKEKIRVRSYGLTNETSPVFLEIKRKNDGVVYKRRIVTTEAQVNSFLNENDELNKTQIGRELVAFKEKYGKLEPKYLIISDRLAYIKDNSDVRVTLDLNPRYRIDNLNLHSSSEGIPLLEEGDAILEIKVQNSVPIWLTKILTEGKIYKTTFSKVGNAHKRETRNKLIRNDISNKIIEAI
jgi:hypothetical protein